MFKQEIIKVREWIPHKALPVTQGSPSLVIFRHSTQFFRVCYSRVAWISPWGFVVSFRFKAKENLQRSGNAFFYTNIKREVKSLPKRQ